MSVKVKVDRDCFRVSEACSVRITVTSDQALEPGDTFECQFPNSWSLISGPSYTRNFQISNPSADHFVSISTPGCDASFKLEIQKRHLTFPEGMVRHGRHIKALLTGGVVPAGQKIIISYENTFAPYIAEEEVVWLRVKNCPPDSDPVLKILPGPHNKLRIIVPSGVEPGKTFDVLIVSLDEFDNASCTPFENESLLLSDGTVVMQGINFTGSVRIPVNLETEGVYRFSMRDTVSNAVRIAGGCHGPYWGDIHIHSKLSHDGQGTVPYKYARDVSGLDFAGVADHWESLGEEGYRILAAWAEEANDPGRFVTIPGDERNPTKLTGHHNIYFRTMETFLRNKAIHGKGIKKFPEPESSCLQKPDESEMMIIPHHTGIVFSSLPENGIGSAVVWDAWEDKRFRPVMEIYSHHGQSEVYNPQHILAYEFNRMRNKERRANTSVPGPFYAQHYWMNGKRIGVIASSDEHSGQGGRPHGGIAAVRATKLTRDGIFDALRQRHCYATTGERILIDFSVDGTNMGECAQQRKGNMLHLSLAVWGTDILLRVDILRFRFGIDSSFQPIISDSPRPESMEASYEIKDKLTGSCMYYARVIQQPVEWPAMAWTSPVWIDISKS